MDGKIEGLIRELRELSQCPLDPVDVFGDHGLAQVMHDYWEELAEQHGVLLFTDLDEAIERSGSCPDDVQSLIEERYELLSSIESLRSDYVKRTRPLFEMKVATSEVQRKHYTKKSHRRSDIIRRTSGKEKASLFFPEMNPNMLLEVLREIMEDCWRDLLTPESKKKIWVDLMEDVGAAGGQVTRYACFHIDVSTPQAHAHPVLETELPSGERWFYADDLQGRITPRYPSPG